LPITPHSTVAEQYNTAYIPLSFFHWPCDDIWTARSSLTDEVLKKASASSWIIELFLLQKSRSKTICITKFVSCQSVPEMFAIKDWRCMLLAHRFFWEGGPQILGLAL